MINLAKDTINKKDIKSLIGWLETEPKLTKGELTERFEEKWSEWLGVKYSVFVNSGSSANLATLYALILENGNSQFKVLVPAVSWATTVAPVLQLGCTPVFCECDKKTLGPDINHLKYLLETEKDIKAAIIVHVLGFPSKIKKIKKLCKRFGVSLIEDTCEAAGSYYKNKMLGTFGRMSTFSFYFGHLISTIEGGMISTDEKELYEVLKSIRSHGWDRDLSSETRNVLRKKYNIDDFHGLYTFYYPGFNLRSTDLQAFMGLEQMKKINRNCYIRDHNLRIYDEQIQNPFWKIAVSSKHFMISNFAYPIIVESREKLQELVSALEKNEIETRPLVCGSMLEQPYYSEKFKEVDRERLKFAKHIHECGLYLPNHASLTIYDIKNICNIVNQVLRA